MTQQTNTTNWVIQGSNGQPQMIKLVQPSGKPIMTSTLTGQPVKIYKSPPAESSQVFTTATAASPILKAIRGSIGPHKILTQTIPINVGSMPKGTRTIRLTQSQMQNIKIVPPPSTQKVQTSFAPTSTTTTQIPIISQSPATIKSVSPPILSRKRHDTYETDYTPESKRGRKSEKVGKGLRHFSMKVCEKVRQKGMTTYNEVADELVGEFTNSTNGNSLVDHYDQKNIRRRVYDALNVLMAMNIISKEKKDIRWIGLPTNSQQECHQLEKEVAKKISVIREKEKQLDDLIMNQIAFKNLAQRNIEAEKVYGVPPDNFCIQLPFIVVNTNNKTVINCSISNDRMEYLFQFSDKFEISDDVEILKSIGMLSGLDKGDCSPENLQKLKHLIPESLWPYLNRIANGRQDNLDSLLEVSRVGGSVAMPSLNAEEFVEATLEENSRQSSSGDAMSPCAADYSDDDVDSDMSSDLE